MKNAKTPTTEKIARKVNLSDVVYAQAKEEAARDDRSFTYWAERAIIAAVDDARRRRRAIEHPRA